MQYEQIRARLEKPRRRIFRPVDPGMVATLHHSHAHGVGATTDHLERAGDLYLLVWTIEFLRVAVANLRAFQGRTADAVALMEILCGAFEYALAGLSIRGASPPGPEGYGSVLAALVAWQEGREASNWPATHRAIRVVTSAHHRPGVVFPPVYRGAEEQGPFRSDEEAHIFSFAWRKQEGPMQAQHGRTRLTVMWLILAAHYRTQYRLATRDAMTAEPSRRVEMQEV